MTTWLRDSERSIFKFNMAIHARIWQRSVCSHGVPQNGRLQDLSVEDTEPAVIMQGVGRQMTMNMPGR